MKLLLIRHAESEHNVTGLLAGVTDSKLTNHGVLQAQRLGNHLIANGFRFTHIFSSDLQRAWITAEAIQTSQRQSPDSEGVVEVVQLAVLREQDYGSLECVPWSSKADKSHPQLDVSSPDFKPKETAEAMRKRGEDFLNDYLLPLLYVDDSQSGTIAVVSHGIFLAALWRCLLAKFPANSVKVAAEVGSRGGVLLEYLPSWSNTGFLELDITAWAGEDAAATVSTAVQSSDFNTLSGWRMTVKAANVKDHLNTLKRTRGGVGSATYDVRQKKMEGFFKKQKTGDPP